MQDVLGSRVFIAHILHPSFVRPNEELNSNDYCKNPHYNSLSYDLFLMVSNLRFPNENFVGVDSLCNFFNKLGLFNEKDLIMLL